MILTAGTFGTINSSPWFNLGIAVLFVVLALAMFDVLVIDFSRFGSGFTPGASRGSLALAFTMGAVAALLAGTFHRPAKEVAAEIIKKAGRKAAQAARGFLREYKLDPSSLVCVGGGGGASVLAPRRPKDWG